MLDPSLIGTEVWSATLVVEAGAVLRFGESTGEPARRTGSGDLLAPPAFLLNLVPFDALARVAGVAADRLHASEAQLEQLQPVRAGDRLVVRSRVVDVVQRPGSFGDTVVLTLDDEARLAGSDGVAFRARRVYALLAVREAA